MENTVSHPYVFSIYCFPNWPGVFLSLYLCLGSPHSLECLPHSLKSSPPFKLLHKYRFFQVEVSISFDVAPYPLKPRNLFFPQICESLVPPTYHLALKSHPIWFSPLYHYIKLEFPERLGTP